ncbi:uncharacterized protein LOC115875851 [Sitophilus oryzae]|uniref:Uncharacterized protein LOC115875851 n=1 Tax=Sitophilus oryzae TaxID=7048 RepID=A0A6J2X7N7_SITOR|nr:uncharacterized protein LOC115875851 [Sitophilus oryzae]
MPQQLAGANRYASLGGNRPTTIEQYEQLIQQRQNLQNSRGPFDQTNPRHPLAQRPSGVIQRPSLAVSQSSVMGGGAAASGDPSGEQEIPDNVTAELEKLEQETGTMAELQGVSEILGGLGDDDDELLAEMGADFNILEYADPELEALAGEKTNILDLDLEEDHLRQERKKEAALRKQASTATETTTTTTTTTSTPTETPKPAESMPINAPLREAVPAEQLRRISLKAFAHNILSTTTSSSATTSSVSTSSAQQHPPAPQHHSSATHACGSTGATYSQTPTAPSSPSVQQPTPQQSHLSFTAQQIHQQMLQQVGSKMSKYVLLD